uniref:Protein kinase domain-containing protein n=1 Tax=Panagrolaimus superbus TaxID=310955 RepID=A0A914Z211_9BILA
MFSVHQKGAAIIAGISSNVTMDSKRNGSTSATASSASASAEDEVPVEETLFNLKNLMLNPIKSAPPSNKLKIVTRSAVERFNLTVEEPISFQWLENYYKIRHAGMEFKIYHANNTFDFLQKITSQNELDEAIRLHKLRSKDSKFRLSIVPKIEGNSDEVLMRPDPRGIFHGINYEDTYSETGTSAFTVAMVPIRQRLQEVLSQTTDIPMPPTDWREGACIGQGAHGRVLLCIDTETHEHLVVKKIFAKGEVSSMRRRMFNLAEEISMLSKLSHENIVKYRGVIISDTCVNIFMEYMTAGSLYDEINKKGFGALSPKSSVETTRQILRGLEYLHDLEIVHRYHIKSANILRHAYPVVFKIGDFGSAQYYRALASLNSIDYSSTPHYTAPELVKSNHPYDDKADIWSMGIVMIEMLTKKPPYSDIEPNAVLFKIAEGPIKYKLPDDCPQSLANVIAIMLNVNPRKRPSAKELLKMDVFS